MEEKIKLDKVIFEFTQEEHCMSNEMGGVESLTIECTSDLGITDTDGAFFVLKTEQWAINDLNDLKQLFDKIQEASIIINKNRKGNYIQVSSFLEPFLRKNIRKDKIKNLLNGN